MRTTFYTRAGKRALDLALVIPGFLLVLLPMALTSLLVRLLLGPPVLYRQVRPGLHGAPFTMLKFRTMLDRRDESGRSLPDEQRMTPFGRLLRATSLDELPELFNVLRGEMSLVGPRPLLTRYLERYSPEQARRHDVPPGITGWAQVHGRNLVSWDERFELDVWYVDHCSFGLDLKILFMTIGKVFSGEGVSAAGHATMHEFMGPRVGARADRAVRLTDRPAGDDIE